MFKTKKQQAAGAVCSAMEQRPFQKRVQLKNQRSRGNLLKMSVLFCFIFCNAFVQAQDYFVIDGKLKGQPIYLSIDLTEKSFFMKLSGGSVWDNITADIEKMSVFRSSDGSKRIDLYLSDWSRDGSRRYFMITQGMMYMSDYEKEPLLGVVIEITKIYESNFDALVKAVEAKIR